MKRRARPGSEPPRPERTVLGLIKDLQAGRTTGGHLSASDRRRVVEHLWAEGYGVPEIAEVVGVDERTVQRDRQSIRQANALQFDEGLVPEMVGGLVRQAEVTIGRLRRVARDRETPAASKVDAEMGCWQVGRELVQTLQRLGYLPTAPDQVMGLLRLEHPPEYTELQRELERVEACIGPELTAQITKVKETLVRLAGEPPQAASVGPSDAPPA